jgi:hypothetical protein
MTSTWNSIKLHNLTRNLVYVLYIPFVQIEGSLVYFHFQAKNANVILLTLVTFI